MSHKFSFDKQPAEKLTIGVDFDDDLASGETISTAAVTEIDLATGIAPVSTVKDGSESISGSVVSQKLKAGTNGSRYKITIRATTDAPHIFEADVVMSVTEL
jgi:hypothetical protein